MEKKRERSDWYLYLPACLCGIGVMCLWISFWMQLFEQPDDLLFFLNTTSALTLALQMLCLTLLVVLNTKQQWDSNILRKVQSDAADSKHKLTDLAASAQKQQELLRSLSIEVEWLKEYAKIEKDQLKDQYLEARVDAARLEFGNQLLQAEISSLEKALKIEME